MKIIVCCEGPNDVGPIICFLKRCVNTKKIDVECETHKSIKNTKIYHNIKNNRVGMIKKLYALALIKDSNHIGYHQDTDDNEFIDVYDAIKNVFGLVVSKKIKWMPIVPQKTMESWLLSDKKAYQNITRKPSLPSAPEEIWGSFRDPNGNHPKKYFMRIFAQNNILLNRKTYTQIAENTNIEVLKSRCPKSFGQFYTDVQSFIKEDSTL